ncbi:DUF1837 domain-containing protein [Flavobacterium sp. DG1-102-2]|uniref:HamA C-terminal domain-containing protein n=1 Tax=Flavobacterium sp. DG1-102-2 TaxID=3081663 RepID=UPI0029491C13|nr:DUF1837 domain-containing protein [Flavobacterium sp. DG1-102-2]MDV6167868.1 DUF1837 domain-containing protein [Flavobacterium sp. DG1-102-2]
MSDLIDKVKFEILLDDSFTNVNNEVALMPIDKKHVLSIINDFEDGAWRYTKFQNFIWDNIKETALSARERASLIDQEQSALVQSAKKLRLTDGDGDIGKGSELAEIVLYGIMKHHFGALPTVPKIFYKQNSQDNAKGADSVHIVVKDGDFTLWFGEAKFYNDIQDARLGSIVQSFENSLTTEKLELENSIITNVSDLDILVDDIDLRKKILDLISPGVSMDQIKPKLHIPILILHQCSITEKSNVLSQEYKDEILEFHKERAQSYFKKQLSKFSETLWLYSEVTFHIILFPVPSKEVIVNKFIDNVEFFKNQ